MEKMKLFIDLHDAENQTFPKGISKQDFAGFHSQYEKACREEGVVNLNILVGFDAARAFCLNLAPNIEAVKRAHEKVGLPYDTIVEINSSTPTDIFFNKI